MLTLEITVSSPDEYSRVLNVLDAAADEGKLELDFTVEPALSSLRALAEHELLQQAMEKIDFKGVKLDD